MNKKKSVMRLVIGFWLHLSRHRQQQSLILFVLMLIVTATEVVGVGAILPFLGMLTAPEYVFSHELMQPFIIFLQLTRPDQLVLPLTLGFIMIIIITGIVRLVLLYAITRFTHATGADVSFSIYRRTLYQEYSTHISRNSSELINGIINKTGTVVNGVLLPVLTLISSSVLVLGIMVLLFFIDAITATIIFTGFGVFYLGVTRFAKKRLEKNSQSIAVESTNVIKSLQEGLGGIRDVLIDGSQLFYCQWYHKSDLLQRRALGENQFITLSPRYIIESIGIVLIAFTAYLMSQKDGGIETVIPVLGALALGAQRMLPALQHAYASISTIKGSQFSLQDVIELLNQPLTEYEKNIDQAPILFQNKITLNNVGFRYSNTAPWVISDVSITFAKGSVTGIIGETGSGKSTLLDIFMGLLKPSLGSIVIDNQEFTNHNRTSWQKHIAHVPQNIFLSDASIEENIAFGIPKEEIDHNLVRLVSRQAQIHDSIERMPMKYHTVVGECGVRLSGGQRQRIGIARALYKKSDVLVFDEATSALDSKTESSIMKAIESLDKNLTIIIIAHRLTTLKNCDQIIEIRDSRVAIAGSYNNLMKVK